MATTPVKLDSSKDIYTGELFVFIGESPIAFASTANLEISVDKIDISNKMFGRWSGALAGKKSFSISSEALLTRKEGAVSYDALLDKMIADEVLEFYFGSAKATDQDNFGGTFTKDTAQKGYSGKVIITSLSLKSDNGQIASCSVAFEGVGKLLPVEPVTVMETKIAAPK